MKIAAQRSDELARAAASASATPALRRRLPRYHRWPAVLGSIAAVLAVIVATGEALGWPMLAEPMQRWLSLALHRRVSLAVDGQTPGSVAVRLVGRLRIEAPLITVAAPEWSHAPAMLQAREAVISLHYADLWRAHRGQPLRVHMLEAAQLDVDIERLADGRASWLASEQAANVVPWPLFDQLKADAGTLRLRDDKAALQLSARFSTVEPAAAPARADALGSEGAASVPSASFQVEATGQWDGRPLRLMLRARPGLPWVDRDDDAERVSVVLEGSIADVPMGMTTAARDVWSAALLAGRLADERVPHGAPK